MKIERRDFLKTGVLGAAGLAAGCDAACDGTGQSERGGATGTTATTPPTASSFNLMQAPDLVIAVGGALITDIRAGSVVCLFPPGTADLPHKPVLMVPASWLSEKARSALGARLLCADAVSAWIGVENATIRVKGAKAGTPQVCDDAVNHTQETAYSEQERLSLQWLVPLNQLHQNAPLKPEPSATPRGQVVMDAGQVFSWWNKHTPSESWDFQGASPITARGLSDWTLNALARDGASTQLGVGITASGISADLTDSGTPGATAFVAVVNWPHGGAEMIHRSHLPLLYGLLDVDPASHYTMVANARTRTASAISNSTIRAVDTFLSQTVYDRFRAAAARCPSVAGFISSDSSGCPNARRR